MGPGLDEGVADALPCVFHAPPPQDAGSGPGLWEGSAHQGEWRVPRRGTQVSPLRGSTGQRSVCVTSSETESIGMSAGASPVSIWLHCWAQGSAVPSISITLVCSHWGKACAGSWGCTDLLGALCHRSGLLVSPACLSQLVTQPVTGLCIPWVTLS